MSSQDYLLHFVLHIALLFFFFLLQYTQEQNPNKLLNICFPFFEDGPNTLNMWAPSRTHS